MIKHVVLFKRKPDYDHQRLIHEGMPKVVEDKREVVDYHY